ncbi:hypothetical protein BH18ACI2_BH18ACI2_20320 [soil metagenome]
MDATSQAFINQARTLLTRNYLPRIERCLEQLTDADVWWRDNTESNSIGNLLLHLAGNVRQWIVSGVGGAADVRERDAEFEIDAQALPAGELLRRLCETLAEADEVLARLAPSRLLEACRIQGRDGVTVLEAVFHVVEHFSMHTGQIILLTKIRTGRDLAFYEFNEGVPCEKWHEK